MDNNKIQKILSYYDDSYDVISSLESIISITLLFYLNNAEKNDSKVVNNEREHCINMLNLAAEKIGYLKEINKNIEKNIL